MSIGELPPQSVAPVNAILGEGPVWSARDDALWFVDIKSRLLHRFSPAAKSVESWTAPAQIGWALPAQGGGLVAGLQDGVYRFSPDRGTFALLAEVEPERPGNRLNDATTDAHGRIWFGSMDDGETDATGKVYLFDRGRISETGIAPVAITNGPALSPDGLLLYHTDTLAGVIHASRIDHEGQIGDTQLFARIDGADGYPDGSVVDSEGCLWVGLFGGWAARRYAPDGRLLDEVRFPVANITKLAFGGADLRTVYATTASKGLSSAESADQPLAGNLFAFRSEVAGLPVTPAILA